MMRARGFSLIEVNMAILVVAGGLLTLFALFPAGLRMSAMSNADMRQSMFADEVIARMRANAETITDLEVWMDAREFWGELTKGKSKGSMWTEMARSVDSGAIPVSATLGPRSTYQNSPYYTATGEMRHYFASKSGYVAAPARFKVRLQRARPNGTWQTNIETLNREVSDVRDNNLDYLTWRISIVVSDQEDVVFEENPTYHTEVRFRGSL